MRRLPRAICVALAIAGCGEASSPVGSSTPLLAPKPSSGILTVDLGSPTVHLGSLDAGSVANDVNANAVAVGHAATRKFEPGSFLHAMRWTYNAATGTVMMEDLMSALGLPNEADARALAINDAGVVVGVFSATDGAPYHGFVLEPGQMTDVHDLGMCSGAPVQGVSSMVLDVNNRGEAIGGRGTGMTDHVAFVFSVAARCLVELPTLGISSHPATINDNSVIAGTSYGPSGGRPVTWTRASTGEWTIRVIGSEDVQIHGISELGDVAGTLQLPPPSPGHVPDQMAFAWLGPEMTPTQLGNLGAGQSGAYGMSSTGRVVGWAHNKQLYMRPFLWTAAGMRDLGTLGGPRGSANAITGPWIVGNSEVFTKGREITGHATLWWVP